MSRCGKPLRLFMWDFDFELNFTETDVIKMKPIKRGDIYYAGLNPVVGSEQGETRPVLVVQNNLGNKYSPTLVVVPITRRLKKNQLPTHVYIPQTSGLAADSLALVEQIRTIDRMRLREYIGRIGKSVQSEIDTALAICVGIHASVEECNI